MEVYQLSDTYAGDGTKGYAPDHGSFIFSYQWTTVTYPDRVHYNFLVGVSPKNIDPIRKTIEINCQQLGGRKTTTTFDFLFPESMIAMIDSYANCGANVSLIVCIKDISGKKISPAPELNIPNKNQFIDDFSRLLYKEETMDVTFKLKLTEIKAHKVILAARSPVFEKMFDVDMKEKATNEIELNDASPDAFKLFLKFIYSNHYESNHKLHQELMYLGEKYDVTDLKTIASQELLDNITANNAIETLIHFDLHGISQLKIKAASFIAKNKEVAYTKVQRQELQRTHPNLVELIDCAIDAIESPNSTKIICGHQNH